MKMLSTVLAVAAVMGLGAKLAAQEAKGEGVLVVTIQDLNLTDEQEAKIADIMKEFRTRNADALKELTSAVKEEMEKVDAVLTPAQTAKLETLKEERKEAKEECLAASRSSPRIARRSRRCPRPWPSYSRWMPLTGTSR